MAPPLLTYEQFTHSGVVKPDTCAICLEQFDKDHPIVRIDMPDCHHVFGQSCLETWFKHNNTYPSCRATLFAPRAPPPPPRLDSIEDPQLAGDFVTSLIAGLEDHASAGRGRTRQIQDCLQEALDLHGIEYRAIRASNLYDFWFAVFDVVYRMYHSIKKHNGRLEGGTQYWVYRMGRVLGWPDHVIRYEDGSEQDDEHEEGEEDADVDGVRG